jgi:hypothetical protein
VLWRATDGLYNPSLQKANQIKWSGAAMHWMAVLRGKFSEKGAPNPSFFLAFLIKYYFCTQHKVQSGFEIPRLVCGRACDALKTPFSPLDAFANGFPERDEEG